jgi:hypothetical protein
MEAGMQSEQVYWVFAVTVDQMDKFTPLIPKLVAATDKEPRLPDAALDPAILSLNDHPPGSGPA